MDAPNASTLRAAPSPSRAAVALIEGGPGTGKTTALVNKIAGKIKSGLRPDRLIVVVAGRLAATRFRELLAQQVGKRAEQVLIGPAADLARGELQQIGLGMTMAKPGMMNRCAQIAASTIGSTNTLMTLDLIRAIKSGQRPTAGLSDHELDLIRLYNRELHRRNHWDAEDILQHAIDAYEDTRLPAASYLGMAIDDGQELSPVALRWVRHHRDMGVPVTVACSGQRAVFSFTGAGGMEALERFAVQSEAQRIKLTRSWRCTPQLLGAATAITGIKGPSEGATDRVNAMAWSRAESRDDEINQILHAAHEAPLTVLARSKGYLDRIEVGLIGAGVGYVRESSRSVLAQPPFRAMIDVIRVCDEPSISNLKNALNWLKYDRQGLKAALRGGGFEGGVLDLLENGVPESLDSDHPVIELMRKLEHWRQHRESVPSEVFQDMVDWLVEVAGGRWSGRLTSLPMAMAGRWVTLGEVADLLEAGLLRSMGTQAAEQPITLTTLHSAFGREFDRVWIAGVAEGHFPSPHFPRADEMAVLYLGMTRTRRDLMLSGVVSEDTEQLHTLVEESLEAHRG